MRWLGRLMTSAAAVLLAAGGASAWTRAPAPSSDSVAWDAAVESDSVEAYAAFLLAYPRSQHAPLAYDRLSGLAATTTGAEAAATRALLFSEAAGESSAPGILPPILIVGY
jgi:hypothetical protein